jgi:hypothetical protein
MSDLASRIIIHQQQARQEKKMKPLTGIRVLDLPVLLPAA